MIEYKSLEVKKSYLDYDSHPTIKKLVEWLSKRYKIVITQGYEKRDYYSVHSEIPFRGVDIRSWIYTDPQKVVEDINNNWSYDELRPEKMCAIYHDTGSGDHIHLQVHNNTRYIS